MKQEKRVNVSRDELVGLVCRKIGLNPSDMELVKLSHKGLNLYYTIPSNLKVDG